MAVGETPPGLPVESVKRLIQDQNIRTTQKGANNDRLPHFSGGKNAERSVNERVKIKKGETAFKQRPVGVCAGSVCAGGVRAVENRAPSADRPGLAAEELSRGDAVLRTAGKMAGVILLPLPGEQFMLGLKGNKFDPRTVGDNAPSRRGRNSAGEGAHEGGLAAPVWPDDNPLLAPPDFPRRIVEKVEIPEPDGDAFQRHHRGVRHFFQFSGRSLRTSAPVRHISEPPSSLSSASSFSR